MTTQHTETIDRDEALDRIEEAARQHPHDFKVKRTDDAVLVGRVLSRGRFQSVGRIWIDPDGEVCWEANRVRSTVRELAETVQDCRIETD